ncbi:MAG: hypothetical protein JSW47_05035 [Phycisphaerales bacterium]|nr:MAG: hypothetical protein JSW47_05035 [Phycisphaerales bacterium]
MLIYTKDCVSVLKFLVLAYLGMSTASEQAEESEKNIPLSEVPPPIRTIVERELGKAMIEDIELVTKDGKTIPFMEVGAETTRNITFE